MLPDEPLENPFHLLSVEVERLVLSCEGHLLGRQPALRGAVRWVVWRVQPHRWHPAARVGLPLAAALVAAVMSKFHLRGCSGVWAWGYEYSCAVV